VLTSQMQETLLSETPHTRFSNPARGHGQADFLSRFVTQFSHRVSVYNLSSGDFQTD